MKQMSQFQQPNGKFKRGKKEEETNEKQFKSVSVKCNAWLLFPIHFEML